MHEDEEPANDRTGGPQHAPEAPALEGDAPALRCESAELRDEVASVAFHDGAKLRGARDAAGCRERLGDVVGCEEAERSFVHAVGVGPHREDEHHVRKIDGLAPRRRADLHEERIDEVDVAIPRHQVGGLDVAMGQAGVPQRAHDLEPFVDDVDIDVDGGVTDLAAAVEELGHEHVLPLGRDLDDS